MLGSLGIPRIGVLEKLGLQQQSRKEFLFYDTSISNCIENAFQALALDENRASFSPAVWEKPRGNTTVSIYAVSKGCSRGLLFAESKASLVSWSAC